MFCTDEVPDTQLITSVHDAFPQATIYVRGFDRRSIIDLANSPVEYVMREVSESALRMALMALENVGLSEEEIERAEATYRENDHRRMELQIKGGDIYAAQEMTREQQDALRGEN